MTRMGVREYTCYTNPTMHSTIIPQYTILWQKCAHVCTFLSQNGALWDICLMHCGICKVGLLAPYWSMNITWCPITGTLADLLWTGLPGNDECPWNLNQNTKLLSEVRNWFVHAICKMGIFKPVKFRPRIPQKSRVTSIVKSPLFLS